MAFLKSLLIPLVSISCVLAASLQRINGFGTNPTNVEMWAYRPDKLPANPGLLIALHYCQGTAQAYFSGTQYSRLADQYGFIVIYPDAPDPGQCWDVHSDATFKHNAGGDSLGIASMARYAISTWGVNANRVFATGGSSGGMMTNVLLGAYPDVFKGGAAVAGVPYGCFAGPGLWNSACAQGQVIKTAAQWGDLVRAGYPGFTGTRPKVMLWHGTSDATLRYPNFGEAIKQWTNVLGVSQTPSSTQANNPFSGYTKTTYGPNIVAYSAQGVGHDIKISEAEILAFFGLNGSGTTVPNPPASTTAGGTTPLPTSNPPSGSVPQFGQCGGEGWNGATACVSPFKCTVSNQWYSQCL